MEWKPDYEGNLCKKEEGDGQWHAEIRLTDPYENVYDQDFKTKPTKRKLSKYHKLSTDISKIIRKQSKTGKHGHENQKSDQKPEAKPEKSSPQEIRNLEAKL
ncbi:hypothetical protein Tco_0927863 [Tanacetum coccineum]